MQSRWPASNSTSSTAHIGVLFGLLILCACSGEKSNTVVSDDRAAILLDEQGDLEARLDLMDSLEAPCPQEIVEALLQVMKDRSQQAYITVPVDSDLGYEVRESPYGGPDRRAELRWTAVMTLERLGEIQALPDLLAALNDRHGVVANHAARALWRLGSTEGLQTLVDSLKAKAFQNETANRILKEISGQDFGFDTDGGWANKEKAIQAWQAWVDAGPKPPRSLPTKGMDADLDRRVRFLVQILGQHQFLFMEQARRELSKMGALAIEHIREGMDSSIGSLEGQLLRAYAVQSLALMDDPRAQALIVERLETDPAASVRSRAAESLGHAKSGGEAALRKAIDDPDSSVVIAAIRALGRRGIAELDDHIRKIHDDARSSPRLKLTAAMTLLRNGQANAAERRELMDIMLKGAVHERAELAELLQEWQGDLLGWDETSGPEGQEEAIAAWRKLILG